MVTTRCVTLQQQFSPIRHIICLTQKSPRACPAEPSGAGDGRSGSLRLTPPPAPTATAEAPPSSRSRYSPPAPPGEGRGAPAPPLTSAPPLTPSNHASPAAARTALYGPASPPRPAPPGPARPGPARPSLRSGGGSGPAPAAAPGAPPGQPRGARGGGGPGALGRHLGGSPRELHSQSPATLSPVNTNLYMKFVYKYKLVKVLLGSGRTLRGWSTSKEEQRSW